jgi:histone acetyltransferase MYST1
MRTFTTTLRDDGSAVTHVSVQCTLADIARVTNLRIEDAAFALNECGLLVKRIKARVGNTQDGGEGIGGTGIADVAADDVVMLTRQMIEKVAQERNVKKPCMDRAYVLL